MLARGSTLLAAAARGGGPKPPAGAPRPSTASAAATIRTSSAISAATLTATPTAEAASATAAAASRQDRGPIRSACRNAALPARNSATPQPSARHGPAGSVRPVFTMACLTPEASATTPSSRGT